MRIWLIGMSGPGSLSNLRELIDPIKGFFNGVVWVLHDAHESEEASYLESVKGEGQTIHYHYHGRHDVSRNTGLWCGPIKQGDWCVGADDRERINPQFAAALHEFLPVLAARNINAAFLHGKHFIFQYHESLRYQGTPHEGITRDDGQLRPIDLKDHFPNERQTRYGVRAEQRDSMHWLTHYLKYYLQQPWGSNHCLLGNVDRPERGDQMMIYRQREATRLELREYLRAKGVPLTVEGFREYVVANPRDPDLIRMCNLDKITNDGYRYWVLGDETVNDNHHWRDMKVIT